MAALVSIVATLAVFLGVLPVLSGLYQYLFVLGSAFHTHLEASHEHTPRLAIIIPAWNEEAVIATSIDRLMALNYPPGSLRVYLVDDASTDATPDVAIEKSKEYPNRLVHVRRVAGGEGKAATLNYGLDIIWKSDWAEALLIMDADVIYTEDSLRKMARHLADSSVGAVTANIKEGSRAPNYVQRFITFEYVTATGCSRRAQNAFGFLACLSGGAQLHTRENLMAIGGQIFHETLAEDTFTTFRTQLCGRVAMFEPNAVVYAEEPDGLVGLWKQRVRWGRGNVQVTREFRNIWARRSNGGVLGSWTMAFLWFSLFLMPLFQIGASLGLITLYVLDPQWSWTLFRGLWIIAGLVYVFVTLASFVVDWESCRKSWAEGFLFPGLVSLAVISHALFPFLTQPLVAFVAPPQGHWLTHVAVLFLYAWLSLSMVVAWIAKRLEGTRWAAFAPACLYLGGYGAFLCAVTFASYLAELRGADMKWDKTVKTGKVG